MSSDLVTFIEQRLTEDELWARAASAPASYYLDERPVPPNGAHWTWAVGDNWTPYAVNPLEEFVGEGVDEYAVSLVTVEQWPSRYGPEGRTAPNKVLQAEEVSTRNAGHIARHDPARVLREVEAKRRIVSIHNRRADVYPDAAGGTFENCCQGCGFEGVCEDPVIEDVNDCPELKALAGVWSEHPDYRAEWSP